MKLDEDRKHDILLIISSLLFIIFASGLAARTGVPTNEILIPPVS